MESFTQFIQRRVGATYSLRQIIDNLTDEDILFEIEEYVELKTKSKKCSLCHEIKPLSGFSPHSGGVKGVHSACKECMNKSRKKR